MTCQYFIQFHFLPSVLVSRKYVDGEMFENVSKLLPFLYHHIGSVRRAALDTCAVVVPQVLSRSNADDAKVVESLQMVLRHVFQRSLLEENEFMLKAVEKVGLVFIKQTIR